MNTKSIGITLAVLWALALVWVLVLLRDEEPAQEGGAPSGAGGAPLEAPLERPAEAPSVPSSAPRDPARATDGTESTAGANAGAPGDVLGSSPVTPPDDLAPPEIVLGDPDEHERRILKRIFEPLEAASERYAKHDDLEESRLFGEDQESNLSDIDRLLDEAIDTLGLSAVDGTRARLREIRTATASKEQQLARDREARLSAPKDSELSAIEKPLTTTRENYDERIERLEEDLADLERERADLEERFVDELASIGLSVSRDTARGLLSTVSGEDFVEMCVVFHNVRLVTVRLQQLTEEAGESLDVAKRYYGSYVVLVRILDHVQKDFVERVRTDQVPRLDAFAQKAEANIETARDNAANGGDPRIAEQNIRSNELTREACKAYARYLLEQAAAVEAQNEALQPRLRDALNTFETVQLSSQVAETIRDARRNFAALLELDVPELRGFENVELQREFERLTDQLFAP
jgi:polyhydroxyalkanoate synthesis regulator phasin